MKIFEIIENLLFPINYSEKNKFKYEYRNSVTSDETTNYSGKNNFEYEYMVTIWTRKRPSTCRK